jgi:hypothetical protein
MPPLRPSWRLQTGALIAAIMTIENYIAFLERVPILRRLGAGAPAHIRCECCRFCGRSSFNQCRNEGFVLEQTRAEREMMVKNNSEEAQKKWEEKVFTHSRKDRTFESAPIS